MADRKISDLTALTAPAAGDYLPIVDISEAAAGSKNKRITVEELFRGVPDGTAAAPAIAPDSDPNTGIFRPSADTLSVSTGGAERVTVNGFGQVAISLGDVDSGAPEPWPVGADSGYLTPLTLQNYYYQCLVLSDSKASVGITSRFGTIAGARRNPAHKAFTGFGVGDSGSSRIIYIGGGSWNTPDATEIGFYTAPTYNETDDQGVLRGSFTSNGYLRMAANSGGIQFNGDTAATNALDDYEEGTFTPVVKGSSTAGTATYGTQQARYTKIGNKVFFEIELDWNSGTGTGNLRIDGLPFTTPTNMYGSATVGYLYNLALTAGHYLMIEIGPTSPILYFAQYPTGGGIPAVVAYDAAATIEIAGFYTVP